MKSIVFFKVSKYFYDESEFIVTLLCSWGQSIFLCQQYIKDKMADECYKLKPNISRTFYEQQERASRTIFLD